MNRKPLSIHDLAAMKRQGEKIACLTAYDASFSALIDQAGIDVMLVGDSLGMVIQGQASTLQVSLDDMIYHTRWVAAARRRAFVIADMPFLTYPDPLGAAMNAAKLMQAGAQMVKLEGARFEAVRFLVDQGIPVCGHLGLLPQSINRLGGYKVQGVDQTEADKILADALQLEAAGAALLVLECVPAKLAAAISARLSIPVIGIGAGIDCDGQVLVLYDMLDIGIGKRPRFSMNFMQPPVAIAEAFGNYRSAVKELRFPTPAHSF
ncbi:3-methyl-2-oxobutanoate hydroxymethyltransferase [Candidatus Methylomicrobium oryzae]|jgi:3-methyl-2-oxobutanoate hydroxymethyltransferase|uniref:3-methyl-2-oxobutanoate hydroxymethyltransferase n=1 Tax=Candidatus Methylomicrobium oryzae TaxID=2802053 RepID=UPI0019204FEB|nr:3-methyl-2-oxobutanoate hydroxymethyltransferase [Methylomicrobium sp. RS1]MBL1263289.1 3-methyl-2-oxobutanoate hydroxymethyltransferase [Methylomicrobium sp. RS1]